jgi:hypothetical protein
MIWIGVVLATVLTMCDGKLLANPLLGGVGGAYPTAEASRLNPAHAAALETSEVYYAPELYKSEAIRVRYPGFSTASRSFSGLGLLSPSAQPAAIFKLQRHVGVGGFLLPPLPFSVEIKKDAIPVVVLGQPNSVDLKAKGELLGAGELTYGRTIALISAGIGITYAKLGIEAALTASGGDTLATVRGTAETLAIRTGVYHSWPGKKLAVGAAMDLLRSQILRMKVDSPLLPSDGPGLGSSGESRSVLTDPLAQVLLGLRAGLSDTWQVMVDVDYKRNPKSQVSYSLVELKEKKRDLYDTLAIRFGQITSFRAGTSFLSGFRYEPAALGPGGRGDGSKTGFGTIELAQIFTGLSPLTPYYEIGFGIEKKFPVRGRARASGVGQWTGQFGLTYSKGSAGIGSSGELPGAYLYKKFAVPVGVIWRF